MEGAAVAVVEAELGPESSSSSSSSSLPPPPPLSDYAHSFLRAYTAACVTNHLTPNSVVLAAGRRLSMKNINDEGMTLKETAPDVFGGGPCFLLDNVTLGEAGCECLAEGLQGIPLTALAASNVYAHDEGAARIVGAITTSFTAATLVTVSLRGNAMQSAASAALLLTSCAQLRHLDLAWNKLGLSSSSFAAMCVTVRVHRALQIFDVSNNILGGPEVGAALAEMIGGNSSLTTLDLSWNNLMSDVAPIVTALSRKNNTLTRLLLDGNSIGAHSADVLRQKLQANERTAWEHARKERGDAAIAAALRSTREECDALRASNAKLVAEAETNAHVRAALQEQLDVLSATYHQHKAVLEERAAAAEAARVKEELRGEELRAASEAQVRSAKEAVEKSSAAADAARQAQAEAARAAAAERGELQAAVAEARREVAAAEDRAAVAARALEQGKEEFEGVSGELQAARKRAIELEADAHRGAQELTRRNAALASAEEESKALRAHVQECTAECATLSEQLLALQSAQRRHEAEAAAALADEKRRGEDAKAQWRQQLAAETKGLEEAAKVAEVAIESLKREIAEVREGAAAAALRASEVKQRDEQRIGALEATIRELQSKLHVGEIEKRLAQHAAQQAKERADSLTGSADEVSRTAAAKHTAMCSQLHEDLNRVSSAYEAEARRANAMEAELVQLRGQLRALQAAKRSSKQQLERRLMEQLKSAMLAAEDSDSALSDRGNGEAMRTRTKPLPASVAAKSGSVGAVAPAAATSSAATSVSSSSLLPPPHTNDGQHRSGQRTAEATPTSPLPGHPNNRGTADIPLSGGQQETAEAASLSSSVARGAAAMTTEEEEEEGESLPPPLLPIAAPTPHSAASPAASASNTPAVHAGANSLSLMSNSGKDGGGAAAACGIPPGGSTSLSSSFFAQNGMPSVATVAGAPSALNTIRQATDGGGSGGADARERLNLSLSSTSMVIVPGTTVRQQQQQQQPSPIERESSGRNNAQYSATASHRASSADSSLSAATVTAGDSSGSTTGESGGRRRRVPKFVAKATSAASGSSGGKAAATATAHRNVDHCMDAGEFDMSSRSQSTQSTTTGSSDFF